MEALEFKVRRSIGEYSFRKRFLGYNCNERIEMLKIKRKILLLLTMTFLPSEMRSNLLMSLVSAYQRLVKEPVYVLERPIPFRKRTIDSFSSSDIPSYFRFRNRDQLSRMFECLNFPEIVRLDNGVELSGEEVFLFGLRRLAFPSRFHDLVSDFGGDITVWSRAFKWFIIHIHDGFSHLIINGMVNHVHEFPVFANAIRKKIVSLGCGHIANDGAFRVIGFIDNTIFATSRPGGGPVHSGVGAPRHDNMIQKAFYTGWKHIHGVKIQTVTLPNGIIADVYGPVSVRHNDLYTLAESGIHDRLRMMQEQVYDNMLYALYGDSAYPVMQCIFGRHENEEGGLNEFEILENDVMSNARETIEWVNNDIKSKFAFVCFAKGLKLRKTNYVSQIILVAALLTNCYNCLNGCNTAVHFDLQPPNLEDYLSM